MTESQKKGISGSKPPQYIYKRGRLSKTPSLPTLSGSSSKVKVRLINYLINQPTINSLTGKKWLSKTMNLLNHYAFFLDQLTNNKKATIIMLLLANRVTYFGQLKRLFGKRVNPASTIYIIEDLIRRGVIRETEKNEFLEEKKIFDRYGRTPIKRFYCLTGNAFDFYSCFEKQMDGLSIRFDYLTKEKERLSNIRNQLTPKALEGQLDFCRFCHKQAKGNVICLIGKKGVREEVFACFDCIKKIEEVK